MIQTFKKISPKAMFGLVPVANAVTAAAGSPPDVGVKTISDVAQVLCNIFTYMFLFAIGISVIMGVYAAFIYVTAQGDSEKVSKATKTLTYVAIGVAVALLARAVPLVVGNFFGATITVCP